ncbi:MAG: hypothetical protein L6Q59_04200 [Ignavibacteriaceae bacterium]|nr:hypothetical protein [Ignavibacteriaceae bacterium]
MLRKSGFILLLFAAALLAQEKVKFEVRVYSPKLPDTAAVYITGNQTAFGGWNPSGAKLNKLNDTLWTGVYYFDKCTDLEYKFTLGTWKFEALNRDGLIPPNHRHKLCEDYVSEIRVEKWGGITGGFKGQVTGNTKIFNLPGRDLIAGRDLIVWLPPSYESDPGREYPLLLMHDGQNIFDPATSAFGVDWQIDEAADSLMRSGRIPDVIIAGLYNSRARSKEYTPGDTGTAFMKYIVDEVIPLLKKEFRVKEGRENLYTGGSSAGGTISFMLVWNYPELFSGAMCFSPAFKIGSLDVVKYPQNHDGPEKGLRFYFDNGGAGLEARLQPGLDEMIKELNRIGYTEGRDYIVVIDKEAEHNEPAWAKRIPAALLWFLSGVK